MSRSGIGVSMSKRPFVCIMLSLALAATVATAAHAATQWYDGPWIFTQMSNCVTAVRGTGAGVRVGFEADPAQAPHVGQTFYARIIFGMVSGCVDPQHASIEILPPPGASLHVDAAHPIRCSISSDGGTTFSALTPCPQHVSHGAYGQALLPPGAAAWPMPHGKIFMVEFPLRAQQPMRGLAGGPCPRDLDELQTLPRNNCLIAVVHIADGYRDPWLLPHQNLVVVK